MNKVPQQIRQLIAEQVSRLLGSPTEVVPTQSIEDEASFSVFGRGRPDSTITIKWPEPSEGDPAAQLIIEGGIHHAMVFCPEVVSRMEEFLMGFSVPASLVLTHERAVIELAEDPLPFAVRAAA